MCQYCVRCSCRSCTLVILLTYAVHAIKHWRNGRRLLYEYMRNVFRDLSVSIWDNGRRKRASVCNYGCFAACFAINGKRKSFKERVICFNYLRKVHYQMASWLVYRHSPWGKEGHQYSKYITNWAELKWIISIRRFGTVWYSRWRSLWMWPNNKARQLNAIDWSSMCGLKWKPYSVKWADERGKRHFAYCHERTTML